MPRAPQGYTLSSSSAASDVDKRQPITRSPLAKVTLSEENLSKGNTAEQGGYASLVSGSYTYLRTHETVLDFVCRLLLEKKKDLVCRHLFEKKRRTHDT